MSDKKEIRGFARQAACSCAAKTMTVLLKLIRHPQFWNYIQNDISLYQFRQ